MNNNIIKINNEKFRSIYISYNMMFNAKKEDYGKYSLITEILSKSSKKYHTLKELQIELNNLYGTNFEAESQKIGDLYNIEFKMEFVNKKFINNNDILEDVLKILYEIIYNPFVENGEFDNSIFEIEKENILSKIKSRKDDKLRYGFSRVEEILCENENYGKYINGDVEEIINLNSKELYKLYLNMLNNASIYINVSGNLFGYENIDYIIENIFKDKINNNGNLKLNIDDSNRKEQEIIEKVDTKQSVIGIGMNVKNIVTEDDKIKMMVYNEILGGSPASKLFQNVREKESLAYTIRSKYNKIKNFIVIVGGIEGKNYNKCKEVIFKQLEDMKNGNILEDEIIAAKETIANALLEYDDSKIVLSKIEFLKYLQGEKYTISEIIDRVNNITLNDIVEISKNIEIRLKYLLGGE